MGLIQRLIEDNASRALDQAEYRKRYDAYTERFKTLQERNDALLAEHEERQAKADAIGGFMFELRELDVLPLVFDGKLWHSFIDHVSVHADGRLVFVLWNGVEITELKE